MFPGCHDKYCPWRNPDAKGSQAGKSCHMELLLEVGVDPKVLADGDVDVPGEDGIGNISPVSIAIKKKNKRMFSQLMNRAPWNTTSDQFLEHLFDIIEWVGVGPNFGEDPADGVKEAFDFDTVFKHMVTAPSVQEVMGSCHVLLCKLVF